MTEEPQGTEKKIIVDEDWKTQVAAEKEALQKQSEEAVKTPPADEAINLPPPSLTLLANSLYLQAAISLGLLPNPLSGKSEPSLAQAKHTIDMLDILQQKTEGNRTPDESEIIDEMLHQLRMAFVSVQEHGGK
jgi:hypothetical protein